MSPLPLSSPSCSSPLSSHPISLRFLLATGAPSAFRSIWGRWMALRGERINSWNPPAGLAGGDGTNCSISPAPSPSSSESLRGADQLSVWHRRVTKVRLERAANLLNA
eukprot:1193948-Prorocentrum_minimum.AAC.5